MVLTFTDGKLGEVWTSLSVPGKSAREQFDRLYLAESERYPYASIDRTREPALARFVPGDGSVIELRHVRSASTIEEVQLVPSLRPRRPRLVAGATALSSR